MVTEKVVETDVVGSYAEMEREGKPTDVKTKLSQLFWHGGFVYDARFSCASNQLFYGILGSLTAYLISILYMEYRTSKER